MNVTLVVPSRNNLKYVKLAYNSIREYIGKEIEIILLDDASTDGTWEWMNSLLDSNLKTYRNPGPERVGHTILYDKGAEMASNEIFGIFHADMVASTTYLPNMLKHLKRRTVVSATRIEPPLHPPGPEKYTIDFGMEPENFMKSEFLQFCITTSQKDKDKTSEGIFAPWMIYKEDFFAIGGHDKRVFAPMELEDSDLFNRFQLAGYKFVQSRDALCYHMTCRGSRFKDGIKIIQEIPLEGGYVWKRSQDSDEYTNLRHIKFREWWRKWHMDVLHDENMKPKVCKRYDIGYVIHNATKNPSILPTLEPWCDSIYTDWPIYAREQYKESEEKNSRFNIGKKLKSLNPINETNNIMVEFDALKFYPEHYKFIKDMMFIIEDSGEVGEFEYDIFKFTIKSMESYEKNLIHADDPWYLSKLL